MLYRLVEKFRLFGKFWQMNNLLSGHKKQMSQFEVSEHVRLPIAVILIFSGTVVTGIWIIQNYPVIYWYDPYLRLVFRDRVLVDRWLPLLQFVIFVVGRITADLTLIRVMLALIAGFAVVGIYLLSARLFNVTAGLISAAMLASNMVFLALSTVPYQEVLFILLLFLGLYFLDREEHLIDRYLAAGFINLACLTRYEGWLLVLILVIETAGVHFRKGNLREAVFQGVRTLMLFGSASLLWLLRGRAQIYTYEMNALSKLNPRYLLDFFNEYSSLLTWEVRPEILILGLMGGVLVFSRRRKSFTHVRILSFLALDLVLISILRSFSPGNLRQTFLVIVFTIPYAAFGLYRLVLAISRLPSKKTNPVLLQKVGWIGLTMATLLIALFSGLDGIRFVTGAAAEPDFYTPYNVGRWLKPEHSKGKRILALIDNDIQPYVVSLYSGIPLDDILDYSLFESLDQTLTDQKLFEENITHVVALYKEETRLTPNARSFQEDLELGIIPSREVQIGTARVWVLTLR